MLRSIPLIRMAAWIVALSATPSPASVGPFTIPIDPSSSSVTVEVCILGGCDSDVSDVSGYLIIALDDDAAPDLIELHDFDLNLTETIDIDVSVFLGGLTATGEDLRMAYAEPGTPSGPVPIEAGLFLFVDVPTQPEGTVAYDATGTVCAALQAAGEPCADARDLSDEGTQTGDMDGTIVIVDGIATLTINPDVEVPLNPDYPDLGTLSMSGTVVGSAPVPESIPTVSRWGLAGMVLLLLTAGTIAFVRRETSER